MKKKLLITAGAFLICLLGFAVANEKEVKAAEVGCTVTSSAGSETNLRDDKVTTTSVFNKGDKITVTSESEVDSIYIKFDYDPGTWTLEIDGKTTEFGGNGILHEFEKLPSTTKTFTITFNKDNTKVCDIWTFNGETPDWVQKWEAPCEKADIMVCNTHADDEILFLGSVLVNYSDKAAVQPVMLTRFYDSAPIRTHEYYNALWYVGITHAPIIGEFYDSYSESLEHAKTVFDYDQVKEFLTEQVRRFKPQVVVGHDIKGEYGHGAHQLYTAAIMDVIEQSADSSYYPESAQKYGTWEPLKTYLHIYAENPIVLDTRTPLERFGGKTGIEVLREAYKQYESQQWCWYYVEDGVDEPSYQYSVAKFGLYKTLVGADTKGNDVLENITTYADQAKEEEAKKAAEAESQAAEQQKEETQEQNGSKLVIVIVVVVIVVAVLVIILAVKNNNAKKRRRRRNRRSGSGRSGNGSGSRNSGSSRNGSSRSGSSRSGNSRNSSDRNRNSGNRR